MPETVDKVDIWKTWKPSKDELFDHYNKWANEYENDVDTITYEHPKLMANKIAKMIEADGTLTKSSRILDVCSGVGYFSVEAAKFGLTNIDALDGTENMLKQAKSKNRYQNYYHEHITKESLKTVSKGAYDIVASSGSFLPGHLNSDVLETLIELIKPGGYFVMGMRELFLKGPYLLDLEDKMKALCDKGVWKLLNREILPKYVGEDDGVYFTFKKN